MEIDFALTFHVYMDVNSDYKNSTWCWNVIGHVENSNINVENTSFFDVENTSFFDVENTSFLDVENTSFFDVENTSVFYVFQTFTSRPNLDVEKRRIFYVEYLRNVHWGSTYCLPNISHHLAIEKVAIWALYF